MPAIKIFNDSALVYLWHITETLDELLERNSKEVQSQSLIYKNETHRKQFLAKHLLLKELNLTGKVSYLPDGKPVLEEGQYISISHSGPYVGLAISQCPVGIDIEKNHPKLKTIANRFINDKDFFKKQTNNKLHWIWTAKESIYKLAGIKGLSFKNDIFIELLDYNKFSGIAMLKNQRIELKFKEIDNTYLFCLAFYVKIPDKF